MENKIGPTLGPEDDWILVSSPHCFPPIKGRLARRVWIGELSHFGFIGWSSLMACV